MEDFDTQEKGNSSIKDTTLAGRMYLHSIHESGSSSEVAQV